MSEHSEQARGLPENAYRPLNPGETYNPVVPTSAQQKEVTPFSVVWGLFFAVVFSSAAAYLGLKIGQVFEAAIPIAILAVGITNLTRRKGALLENVMIQSIGASSGLIVAGAIFTIPGLYILGIDATFWQVFLSSLLGGFLGILFLIPFRRYFVKDMHGEFPFPEATATTEVLVAGDSGGKTASVLVKALLVGGIYDFCVSGLGLWKEVVSSRVFGWGRALSDKLRIEGSFNAGAAVLGLGYIIGLKYSLIIACGSFLSWWVLLPILASFGQHIPGPIMGATKPIADMIPAEIFGAYVRHIGIGGIAAAGIIGIIKSRSIIFGAFKLAGNELFGSKGAKRQEKVARTDHDLSMKWNMIFLMSSLVGLFAFLLILVLDGNWYHAVVGLLVVLVISFLFTTVAARAIAIVGTNPVSGMTLMTLILASVVLNQVGTFGDKGILAALLIGGVVCTALSMAGGFITDLKIGYWLGSTPRNQQRYKFLGTLLSAASVGFVILMLNQTYGFGAGHGQLEAPQASAMAAVIKPLMTGQAAPWLLYLAGAILAVILEWVGVPPLAFALGMYLPIYLNTPLLIGGLVAHWVGKSRGDAALINARRERGTLLASGFIAGGAIMGVLSAAIAYIGQVGFGKGDGWNLIRALGTEKWQHSAGSEWLSLGMYALLVVYLYWESHRARKEA